MNLKQYLSSSRGLQSELAEKIGVYQPDISMWASGKRPIPMKYGPLIEFATNGAVTRRDLFPDTWRTWWPELIDDTLAA